MKKELQEETGERLRAIREALGYSGADFAEALGIGVETYRNYERGLANIPLGVLKALRERFSVNLNYLITGQGNMFMASPVSGQSYLIGERLKALREKLSISSSEFLSYLDTVGSEKELLALENNEKEATEDILEDICESFSINVGWLTGKGVFSPFRSRRVSLKDMPRVCKMYNLYRPEILFTVSSRYEGDPVYFALFLQGEKPFQGILLHENADFAIWREWSYTAKELIHVMQALYNLGSLSVYILDRDTFHYLVIGGMHAGKAMERGKRP
ncbi:MAG: helix-turn-helix transcriptional regulator, partial [Aquificaceae bacterium]|nr:helix-turn-helix transcriptional regulator [Aquificaceae bacterium]